MRVPLKSILEKNYILIIKVIAAFLGIMSRPLTSTLLQCSKQFNLFKGFYAVL